MVESAKAKSTKVHNQVHNDAIWRQVIHNEYNCATTWDKSWGFMKEMGYENARPRSVTYLPPISVKSGMTLSAYPVKERLSDTIDIENLMSYNVTRILHRSEPKDKYIFPGTSSNEYGWVWSNKASGPKSRNTLERFGQNANRRVDTMKWWSGARESLP